MTFTDEELMAWADGELDAVTADRIQAAISADPALAARAAQHRRLRDRVAGAYAPVAAEPVPERLTALLDEPKLVTDLDRRRAERAARRKVRPGFTPWVAAAAAGLATAAVLLPITRFGDEDLVIAQGGAFAPAGPLRDALEHGSGGQVIGVVRVGFSFRTGEGTYCRTFAAQSGRSLSGLACREAEGWRLRALADEPLRPSGAYRTASAETPPAVLAAAEALMTGDPLDASGERTAREGGWRPTRD